MHVQLRPELEKFLHDQVEAGHFESEAEALEAGVARLMLDPAPDEIDQQEITEIRQSLAEMRAGQVVDGKSLHAELRKRYLNK